MEAHGRPWNGKMAPVHYLDCRPLCNERFRRSLWSELFLFTNVRHNRTRKVARDYRQNEKNRGLYYNISRRGKIFESYFGIWQVGRVFLFFVLFFPKGNCCVSTLFWLALLLSIQKQPSQRRRP